MRKLRTHNFDQSAVLVLALLATVLAVTILVYLPGMSGPLLLDDFPQLDGLIATSANDPATVFQNYIVSTSGPFGRPVSMATFIADAIGHGPDIWWWKYGNVMFHLINGLLVFWLTALLLKASTRDSTTNPWIPGAIVAAFWLLHPLHVSTVLYTIQRMTELSSLFVLAGMVAYLKGRLLQQTSPPRGWLLIGLGFGVFYPLSLLSKESGLLYPVFCSLLEFFVLRFRARPPVQKQLKVFHGVLLAGYIAAAAYVVTRFSSVVLENYAVRDFTFVERVFTQFRVVVMYLSQLFLPAQSKMGFFHDDVTISTGLLNPLSTLFAAMLLLAMIVSAYLLRKRFPLYAFGILFFFASHMLESSVFALELMFEHRNYLGSAGLLIAALAVIPLLSKHRKALVVAVSIGLCGFSFLTWQRSLTWSSPASAYDYMYYVHPESKRLNLVLSNIYASADDFVQARQFLRKVGPGPGPEVHELFLDCLQYQKVDESAIAGVPELPDGIVRAHTTSSAQALVREAISGRCSAHYGSLVALLDRLLASPIRSDLDRQSLLFTKAELLESMDRIDASVAVLMSAHDLADNDAMALYRAAYTLARNARPDDARVYLSRALELEMHSRIQRKDMAAAIFLNVGKYYESQGEFEQALATYGEAKEAMPGQSVFYLETGELLLLMRRYDEAGKLLAELPDLELRDRVANESSLIRLEKRLNQYLEASSGI